MDDNFDFNRKQKMIEQVGNITAEDVNAFV